MSSGKKDSLLRIRVRRVKEPPYVVDRSRLGKFSAKNLVFERVVSDPSWKGYKRMIDEKVPNILKTGKPGYSRLDFALSYASWAVHDGFEGSIARTRIPRYRVSKNMFGVDLLKEKYVIDDPRGMSAYIKRAGRLFGACLTGICRVNRDWLYAEADVPERFENAVVMAVEMDADGIATSPAVPAAAATGTGYSKMAFAISCMGEFIRNLGYDAIQCGNTTALSIPLAIDAGLGELGRNGLLITPQYGSRVRLCKIFTDIPLEPDKPIELGVREFCKNCKLCAKECEVEAISMADEPSFDVACPSNNPGALKWYVNSELCYQFWCDNGVDCSTCISVCPFTKASARKAKVSPREFWKTV